MAKGSVWLKGFLGLQLGTFRGLFTKLVYLLGVARPYWIKNFGLICDSMPFTVLELCGLCVSFPNEPSCPLGQPYHDKRNWFEGFHFDHQE